MNKTALIILSVGLLIFLGIIFSGDSKNNMPLGEGENIEIRDGVQYITIDARGGYSPVKTNAQAGIPTKLIVETNGTFDCSAALVIRKANFQEILPQTGTTEIDLGSPKAGETFEGLCSMGMYSFELNFN